MHIDAPLSSIVGCNEGDPGLERISECINSALQPLQLFQPSHVRIEPFRLLDEQRVGEERRRWHWAELALQQRGQRWDATAAVDLLPKEERGGQRTSDSRLIDCLIGRMTNQI